MSYVELREEAPPAGAAPDLRPVHWRLLTSRAVGTVADALDVAGRYAQALEDRGALPHVTKVLRRNEAQGFDIEALRIGEEAPRNRLILACLLAATVVLQMTAERDGARRDSGAGAPASHRRLRPRRTGRCIEAVSRGLEGRTERQKNPHPPGSLAFATWVCARLGGWTGYYGKPGPIVILSGWTEFPVPQARRTPRPQARKRGPPKRCVNPIGPRQAR